MTLKAKIHNRFLFVQIFCAPAPQKRAPGNGWFPGALLIQFGCTAAAAVHSAFYKMPGC